MKKLIVFTLILTLVFNLVCFADGVSSPTVGNTIGDPIEETEQTVEASEEGSCKIEIESTGAVTSLFSEKLARFILEEIQKLKDSDLYDWD